MPVQGASSTPVEGGLDPRGESAGRRSGTSAVGRQDASGALGGSQAGRGRAEGPALVQGPPAGPREAYEARMAGMAGRYAAGECGAGMCGASYGDVAGGTAGRWRVGELKLLALLVADLADVVHALGVATGQAYEEVRAGEIARGARDVAGAAGGDGKQE